MTTNIYEFRSSFCDAFCHDKSKRNEDNCFRCRAERMMNHLDDPMTDHMRFRRKKHEER